MYMTRGYNMLISLPYLRSALIMLMLSTLIGCGGGGGGGDSSTNTPTDPNQVFSLAFFKDTTVGTLYTSNLTGSDSLNNSITGSVTFTNRVQELLGGIMVTPRDLIYSLNIGGTPLTITSTSYIDNSGYNVRLEIQTTGVTCIPASPTAFPDTVQIGDAGILPTLTCDDNTTFEENWRVEDGYNGKINLVTSGVQKDQFNALLNTSEVKYIIDSSNAVVGFTATSTDLGTGYSYSVRSN
jgi:hypothetical protein